MHWTERDVGRKVWDSMLRKIQLPHHPPFGLRLWEWCEEASGERNSAGAAPTHYQFVTHGAESSTREAGGSKTSFLEGLSRGVTAVTVRMPAKGILLGH